jgi:phosphoribosylglycinamide formyltransferase-1
LLFYKQSNAKVIERAKNNDVPMKFFRKRTKRKVLQKKKLIEPDFNCSCVLLKFLENIISAYPNKIINIHPAIT